MTKEEDTQSDHINFTGQILHYKNQGCLYSAPLSPRHSKYIGTCSMYRQHQVLKKVKRINYLFNISRSKITVEGNLPIIQSGLAGLKTQMNLELKSTCIRTVLTLGNMLSFNRPPALKGA